MNLTDLTLIELRDRIRSREVSCREAVEAAYNRIEETEERIHAFLRLRREEAFAEARRIDKELADGEDPGPLAGVPVARKDNLCLRGHETTCASAILKGFIPPYSAGAIEKLRSAGAVIVGATNMDEFAMGSSTENSGEGVTMNPWDLGRIPGGSSGGSAAAVAGGQVPGALGTDTGGSIRQPAALCGVVGMKPTYGRVSRYGLVAFASSLDQIGPFARDVSSSALLLKAIAGHDPRDSTSVDVEVPDYVEELKGGAQGLRLGVPKEYFGKGMDPEIEEAVRKAVGVLEAQGARIEEVSLPHTEYAVATYYVIATAEASSNLARYDGVHYGARSSRSPNLIDMVSSTREEGFGNEVKRRIMLGTYVLSSGYYDAYYLKGLKVRTLIKGDFERAFETVDVILTPTSPTVAFRLGEKMEDPLQMYLSDIFTISANLAGIPAVSLPCGFTQGGLPIGLQISGKAFEESTVLRVAHAYERSTDWHKKRPNLQP